MTALGADMGHQQLPGICTDGAPETVRTELPCPPAGAYQPAARRFELRLTTGQRDSWRAIATRQGVTVADLVCVAGPRGGR